MNPMNFIPRRRKSWPFAVNSTGRLRGILNLGGLVGRVQVYEAIGNAREIFVSDLSQHIVQHLNDNSDELQDSASFVDLSLFMIGKSQERTKPVVMFVSDDKQARVQAFKLVKNSGIMAGYPGFEIGQMKLATEFEDLQPLGGSHGPERDEKEAFGEVSRHTPNIPSTSDMDSTCIGPTISEDLDLSGNALSTCDEVPVEIYAGHCGAVDGRLLQVKLQNETTTSTRFAVSGGFIRYKGEFMLHTVSHVFEPQQQQQQQKTSATTSTSETGTTTLDMEECEVTGLSDFEGDDEDELVDATSLASRTPDSSDAGASYSDDYDDDDDDDATTSTGAAPSIIDQTAHISALHSRLEGLEMQRHHVSRLSKELKVQLGDVAWASKSLDSSFIRISTRTARSMGLTKSKLLRCAIPLAWSREHIEKSPRDAAVRASTPDGSVGGVLSGTPSFIRLPRSRTFQEVYTAKMNRPLVRGDCGSWIRDAVSGKVFGHVVAGSPTTGLVVIMPAIQVFPEALEALSHSQIEAGMSLSRVKVSNPHGIPTDPEPQQPRLSAIENERQPSKPIACPFDNAQGDGNSRSISAKLSTFGRILQDVWTWSTESSIAPSYTHGWLGPIVLEGDRSVERQGKRAYVRSEISSKPVLHHEQAGRCLNERSSLPHDGLVDLEHLRCPCRSSQRTWTCLHHPMRVYRHTNTMDGQPKSANSPTEMIRNLWHYNGLGSLKDNAFNGSEMIGYIGYTGTDVGTWQCFSDNFWTTYSQAFAGDPGDEKGPIKNTEGDILTEPFNWIPECERRRYKPWCNQDEAPTLCISVACMPTSILTTSAINELGLRAYSISGPAGHADSQAAILPNHFNRRTHSNLIHDTVAVTGTICDRAVQHPWPASRQHQKHECYSRHLFRVHDPNTFFSPCETLNGALRGPSLDRVCTTACAGACTFPFETVSKVPVRNDLTVKILVMGRNYSQGSECVPAKAGTVDLQKDG